MKEQLIAFDGGGNSDRIPKRTVKSSVLRLPRFLRGGKMEDVLPTVTHVCVCFVQMMEQKNADFKWKHPKNGRLQNTNQVI